MNPWFIIYRFPYIFGVISAEYTAREIIKAIRKNYTEYSIPRYLLSLNAINRFFPRKLQLPMGHLFLCSFFLYLFIYIFLFFSFTLGLFLSQQCDWFLIFSRTSTKSELKEHWTTSKINFSWLFQNDCFLLFFIKVRFLTLRIIKYIDRI